MIIKRSGKLRAFRDEKAAERAGMWALVALVGSTKAERWCEKNGIVIQKDQTEGVATLGGFLVPDELASAIVDRREAYGVFRATAQPAPMTSDFSTWPATRTGVTTYWVAEGAAITASQSALAAIGLGARKLAALVYTSSELEDDAAVLIGDWLADEMGAAFAQAEDAAAFVGDGTSTYGGFEGVSPGILRVAGASKVTAATGHDTFLELDATDFAKAISVLPAAAVPGAAWFISAYGWATSMLRLQGASGDQVATDTDGRVRPRFMGFPVRLVQSMPAVGTDISGQVMCLFGDMRRAAMLGETKEFTLARSDAGPTFPVDQVAFKGTERVAINVHGLGDATTAGSIVGLVGE